MFNKKEHLAKLRDLELISKKIGAGQDFVQGGGGNTSIKLDDGLMAVKASGYLLSDLDTNQAYAIVHYQDLVKFLAENSTASDKDYNEAAARATLTEARASMETGLHAVLGQVVIHCHSAYANIINCSEQAQDLVRDLFPEACFIAYRSPGYQLSHFISQKANGAKLLFLQNHGLVISADTADEAIELHSKVNDKIKKYFGIKQFPEAKLKYEGAALRSDSDYLTKQLRRHADDVSYEFFYRTLFPDQRVYLQNNIAFSNKLENKINIDLKSYTVRYKTNEREALAIEETLVALFFIIEQIQANDLDLNYISDDDSQHLDNMDSEKHRKKVISE